MSYILLGFLASPYSSFGMCIFFSSFFRLNVSFSGVALTTLMPARSRSESRLGWGRTCYLGEEGRFLIKSQWQTKVLLAKPMSLGAYIQSVGWGVTQSSVGDLRLPESLTPAWVLTSPSLHRALLSYSLCSSTSWDHGAAHTYARPLLSGLSTAGMPRLESLLHVVTAALMKMMAVMLGG